MAKLCLISIRIHSELHMLDCMELKEKWNEKKRKAAIITYIPNLKQKSVSVTAFGADGDDNDGS